MIDLLDQAHTPQGESARMNFIESAIFEALPKEADGSIDIGSVADTVAKALDFFTGCATQPPIKKADLFFLMARLIDRATKDRSQSPLMSMALGALTKAEVTQKVLNALLK